MRLFIRNLFLLSLAGIAFAIMALAMVVLTGTKAEAGPSLPQGYENWPVANQCEENRLKVAAYKKGQVLVGTYTWEENLFSVIMFDGKALIIHSLLQDGWTNRSSNEYGVSGVERLLSQSLEESGGKAALQAMAVCDELLAN